MWGRRLEGYQRPSFRAMSAVGHIPVSATEATELPSSIHLRQSEAGNMALLSLFLKGNEQTPWTGKLRWTDCVSS